MSILFEIKSLFRPVTTVQLAARELEEAKQGVEHAYSVKEYAKREILRAQSLLEYAEASTVYNKGRIERLEALIHESKLSAIQSSKFDASCADTLNQPPRTL